MEPAQQIAKAMEVGGTTVALGSWFASTLIWMDHHSQAVLGIAAVLGVVISFVGMVLHLIVLWHFKAREDKRRQKEHNARFFHSRASDQFHDRRENDSEAPDDLN